VLRGYFGDAHSKARGVAAHYVTLNPICRRRLSLQTDKDVSIGRLHDSCDQTAAMDRSDPTSYNALSVTIHVTKERNQQARFFFASALGHREFGLQATATVAFANHIAGFRTTPKHRTTSLLPFTLKHEDWANQLKHGWTDDWTYDPQSGTVRPGADGIPELKMYPVDSGAGNWGSVDVGSGDNSTAVLERQIREGVSDQDLSGYNGELVLDSATQSLALNGDTGISAGMKDALDGIVGQPRTIFLYKTAEGSGNGIDYTIVGFAGIRIVDVNLSDTDKYILIQPAHVVDPTAVSESWSGESYFVSQPMRLVR
jgi:hypothetical protein